MPIYFEQSGWLLLAFLLIPCWWWLGRSREAFSPRRWWFIGITRSLLIMVLAIAMAEPVFEDRSDGLTVAVIVDRSRSIPRRQMERAVSWLEEAAEGPGREPDDRLAVIQFGRDAVPTAMPDPASVISLGNGPADVTESSLSRAIELAKGLLPRDTANRIVLISDGNETIGNLLETAELARESGLPIDVLPIRYAYEDEVLFDRLIAPSRARVGQSIELRLVLRSRGPSNGRLVLESDGVLVDLNGDEPGHAMPLSLQGGVHVERLTVDATSTGPLQFKASYEPSIPGADRISTNNTASAVTFVSGSGSILIVETGEGAGEALQQAFEGVGIRALRTVPAGLTGGVVGLLGFDAIVLAGVPRWDFNESQVKDLHAYVQDTGGGLLMSGGPEGFGAGGWIGSNLAPAIPVQMDPPAERQLVKGALALIVHSCEMPQGNYWGQRVAEEAIETLNASDEVGIIEKGGGGAKWVLPMQEVGDRQAALSAARKLRFGDMQFFTPSMEKALEGLLAVEAGQRHAIIISDGDPQSPPVSLIDQYIENKVTCTTVMVGGHGNNPMHAALMERIATMTGGSFYKVEDPNELPQIFIKEARVVSRSLIQEGRFDTRVSDAASGPMQGTVTVPSIDGYVLTAARPSLAQVGIVVESGDYQDPLYAWWNYGLGRVVAFTSDLNGLWTSSWLSWARFSSFWEQTIRWVMRSSSQTDFSLNILDEGGGRFVVEMEAVDSDVAFMNFVETKAKVILPGGDSVPLDLQQVGPGRYRGDFQQKQAGTSVVNVNFAGRDSDGELIDGNIQAAVSRAYSDEYRDLVDNAGLLERVAERTGGRVLEIDDQLPGDLFDRESLVMPSTARVAWNMLSILAALLLLLDVGFRRLAVDPDRVREALTRVSEPRKEGSAASISAWQRSKKAAKRQAVDVGRKRGGASTQEQSTPATSGVETPDPPTLRPSPPAEEPPGDDMASRLKAAKNRARKERLGDLDDGDES
ncbi:MAG: hypothetical protein CMJ40_10810 [Phycisphaerae bacterium]|nr:hypothetical protein [Phycisphaerae bacterium]